MQADQGQAKAFYYHELGKRADEAMRDKLKAGKPSGRIPLGYALTP
jgi:hypothetical protein